MPKATIIASILSDKKQDGKRMMKVQLQNDSKQLAFFSRVQLLDAEGEEVLPSYWADNYITLKAGEKQVVQVWIDEHAPTPKVVRVYAWNASEMVVKIN